MEKSPVNPIDKSGLPKTEQSVEHFLPSEQEKNIQEVFNLSPELVNTVYEALGFVDFSVSEKSGYITLYRAEGETVDRDKLLPFQKGNAGTWFSPNQKELLRYVSMMKDRKAYKIDIPKSLYASLNNIAKSNIEMSKGEVQLPIELADKKEILTSENENVINKNYFKSWIISNRIKSGEITESQKQKAEEVYSKYLETIFPDSKVKDIVYHGSQNKFESFLSPGKDGYQKQETTTTGAAGIYFSNKLNYVKEYIGRIGKGIIDENAKGYIYPALVNIKNPLAVSERYDDGLIPNTYLMTKLWNIDENFLEHLNSNNYDSVVSGKFLQDTRGHNEVAVLNSEQIHILGSKQDIEKFKEFVSKNENK